MDAAGWSPADSITLKSSLRIVSSTLLDKPYEDAPVSDLFLFGRKQDFAFEQMVGDSPDKRHHVRFWLSPVTDHRYQPLWLGAASLAWFALAVFVFNQGLKRYGSASS